MASVPHAIDGCGAVRLPAQPGGRHTLPTMSQPFWDVQLETLPPERRRLLREHRLHWQLGRCWDGSPFYRARLEAAGLNPPILAASRTGLACRSCRRRSCRPTADWAVAPESWWHHLDEVPGDPGRVVTDGDAIQQADLAARALWAAGVRPGVAFPLPDAGLTRSPARPSWPVGDPRSARWPRRAFRRRPSCCHSCRQRSPTFAARAATPIGTTTTS